jgi:hypothetical protein
MRRVFRVFPSFLVAFCVTLPASAINTPLSDEAVREAYFLGQRHDGSYPSLMGNYIKRPPAPKSGPHIFSITFLTPFIQLVANSDRFIGNYSAQQAALDHRGQAEFVRIIVEIKLTPTYGAFLAPEPSSQSIPIPRRHDFWRDFQVQVSDGDQLLTPSDSRGRANYNCGRHGYPCYLAGATLEFDLPATAFTSDSATIQVIPPEGDPVSVDFALTRLR